MVILDVATGTERELGAREVELMSEPEGAAGPSWSFLYGGWSWSPDGRSIVMIGRDGARPQVVDVESGEAVELPWETDSLPSWQRVAIR